MVPYGVTRRPACTEEKGTHSGKLLGLRTKAHTHSQTQLNKLTPEPQDSQYPNIKVRPSAVKNGKCLNIWRRRKATGTKKPPQWRCATCAYRSFLHFYSIIILFCVISSKEEFSSQITLLPTQQTISVNMK